MKNQVFKFLSCALLTSAFYPANAHANACKNFLVGNLQVTRQSQSGVQTENIQLRGSVDPLGEEIDLQENFIHGSPGRLLLVIHLDRPYVYGGVSQTAPLEGSIVPNDEQFLPMVDPQPGSSSVSIDQASCPSTVRIQSFQLRSNLNGDHYILNGQLNRF